MRILSVVVVKTTTQEWVQNEFVSDVKLIVEVCLGLKVSDEATSKIVACRRRELNVVREIRCNTNAKSEIVSEMRPSNLRSCSSSNDT